MSLFQTSKYYVRKYLKYSFWTGSTVFLCNGFTYWHNYGDQLKNLDLMFKINTLGRITRKSVKYGLRFPLLYFGIFKTTYDAVIYGDMETFSENTYRLTHLTMMDYTSKDFESFFKNLDKKH